jgi:hypothetical protein
MKQNASSAALQWWRSAALHLGPLQKVGYVHAANVIAECIERALRKPRPFANSARRRMQAHDAYGLSCRRVFGQRPAPSGEEDRHEGAPKRPR